MPTISRTLTIYVNDREGEVRDFPRLRSCVKHLRRLLGKAETSQVWRRITGYRKKRLKEGVSRPTIRRELGVLISAVRLTWRQRRIRYLPYIPLPPRNRPRPWALKPREVRQLLRQVDEQSDLGLFIVIALLTGARISAIVGLTKQQLDFQLRQINFRVDDPLAARMKERAIVPMCPTLRRILLTAVARVTTDRLFAASVRTVQRDFATAVKAAGLPKTVTPHVLRHTAITLMVVGGAGIDLASLTAGHGDIRITQKTYLHLSVSKLRPAVRAVERLVYGRR